jgi:hypothetical protein
LQFPLQAASPEAFGFTLVRCFNDYLSTAYWLVTYDYEYIRQKFIRADHSQEMTVKIKLSLGLVKYHAMKGYWGSGGIAPRILDLGTR